MSASIYPPFRLSFMLPAAIGAFVRPGRHCPCLHGCLVDVHRNSLVTIDGRSRTEVFRQAQLWLRPLVKDRPPFSIAANLITRDRHRVPYQIVVRAEVAFVPGGIEAEIPAPEIENNTNPAEPVLG
jgi:hypothetical protein